MANEKAGLDISLRGDTSSLNSSISSTVQEFLKFNASLVNAKGTLTDFQKHSHDAGKGIDELKDHAKEFGRVALEVFGGGVLLSGVKGIADAFKEFVKSTIEVGSQTVKMAERLGLTIEATQKYQRLTKMLDTDIDSMASALKKQNTVVQEAYEKSGKQREALEKLGLSYRDLHSMSPDQAFEKIGRALAGVENQTQRATIAQEVWGKGAQALSGLINKGVEGYDEAAKSLAKVGSASVDSAIMMEKLEQELKLLEMSAQSAGQEFVAAMGPDVIAVIDDLRKTIEDLRASGKLKEWGEEAGKAIHETYEAVKMLVNFIKDNKNFLELMAVVYAGSKAAGLAGAASSTVGNFLSSGATAGAAQAEAAAAAQIPKQVSVRAAKLAYEAGATTGAGLGVASGEKAIAAALAAEAAAHITLTSALKSSVAGLATFASKLPQVGAALAVAYGGLKTGEWLGNKAGIGGDAAKNAPSPLEHPIDTLTEILEGGRTGNVLETGMTASARRKQLEALAASKASAEARAAAAPIIAQAKKSISQPSMEAPESGEFSPSFIKGKRGAAQQYAAQIEGVISASGNILRGPEEVAVVRAELMKGVDESQAGLAKLEAEYKERKQAQWGGFQKELERIQEDITKRSQEGKATGGATDFFSKTKPEDIFTTALEKGSGDAAEGLRKLNNTRSAENALLDKGLATTKTLTTEQERLKKYVEDQANAEKRITDERALQLRYAREDLVLKQTREAIAEKERSTARMEGREGGVFGAPIADIFAELGKPQHQRTKEHRQKEKDEKIKHHVAQIEAAGHGQLAPWEKHRLEQIQAEDAKIAKRGGAFKLEKVLKRAGHMENGIWMEPEFQKDKQGKDIVKDVWHEAHPAQETPAEIRERKKREATITKRRAEEVADAATAGKRRIEGQGVADAARADARMRTEAAMATAMDATKVELGKLNGLLGKAQIFVIKDF